MTGNYPPGMSNRDWEHVNGVHLRDDDISHRSDCCCAEIYENSDICTACKEHCATIGEEKEKGE